MPPVSSRTKAALSDRARPRPPQGEALRRCDQLADAAGCAKLAGDATPGTSCACHGVTWQPDQRSFQLRARAAVTPGPEHSWLR